MGSKAPQNEASVPVRWLEASGDSHDWRHIGLVAHHRCPYGVERIAEASH
jgi:hypothetical protein